MGRVWTEQKGAECQDAAWWARLSLSQKQMQSLIATLDVPKPDVLVAVVVCASLLVRGWW
jgi:hypothetical protein